MFKDMKYFAFKKIFLTILLTSSFLMLINLKANQNFEDKSKLAITDGHRADFKEYSIHAPSVMFSSVYEINDDYIGASYGDDDNLVDAGETIELRLELENNGDETVNNVYGNLTTTNEFVVLSSFNQSYLHINPGETAVSTSYYILEFNSRFNISDTISFSLQITSDEGTWFDAFQLTIMGIPDPTYYGHIVYSESDGDLNADDDEIVDPGEIIQIQIYVENSGESIIFDVNGYIQTNDIYTTITDDFGIFSSIDRLILW